MIFQESLLLQDFRIFDVSPHQFTHTPNNLLLHQELKENCPLALYFPPVTHSRPTSSTKTNKQTDILLEPMA